MTSQQELELLAEWLGIGGKFVDNDPCLIPKTYVQMGEWPNIVRWNPSPGGNDTDFLNMVAGRVDIQWLPFSVAAEIRDCEVRADYDAHNNDKVAAMKHAAYQVCLMAAKEWKGEQ